MFSLKHFRKPFLPAASPVSDVNSVWLKPQTLELFLIPFSVSQPVSNPSKSPIAFAFKIYHRSDCFSLPPLPPLLYGITLSSFRSRFPRAAPAPYSPQYRRQSESHYSLYSRPLSSSPLLLKSEVFTKACKACTISPSITPLSSSLTISSSVPPLQPHGPPSLHMPGMFPM